MRIIMLLVAVLTFLMVSSCSQVAVTPGQSDVHRSIDEVGEGKTETGHFRFRYYPRGMYPHPLPPPSTYPTTRPADSIIIEPTPVGGSS
jgi:hypothetical protein